MTSIDNYDGLLQIPLNSGFDSKTTAREVIQGIDLTGKTAIVTGGYAGIGRETVRVLASAGASVIVPARDIRKAAHNLAGIANIVFEEMDLMEKSIIAARRCG